MEGKDKPSHKNLGRRKHFVSILNVCSYCIIHTFHSSTHLYYLQLIPAGTGKLKLMSKKKNWKGSMMNSVVTLSLYCT